MSADRALGQRLRKIRRTRGMTQRAMAQSMGLSLKQVQNYESGRSRITVTTMIRFAEMLRTSLVSLLRDLSPATDHAEPSTSEDILLISDTELAHLSRLRSMPEELTRPILELTRVLAQDGGESSDCRPSA